MKSKSSKSNFQTGMVSGLFAITVAFSSFSVTANADDRQQTQQKEAQVMLDVVSEQVNRHMYGDALDRISAIEGNEDVVLSEKQAKQLAVFRTESEAGAVAQAEATKSFTDIEQYLADENYSAAVAELDKVRVQSGYLDGDRAKGLKSAQVSVAELGKSLKGRMKKLFAQSKEYYKQGQLNEAKIGFNTVSTSGIELSFMDRGGDFGTAETYLVKIDEKTAAQAEGQAVAELDTEPTVAVAQEVAAAQEAEVVEPVQAVAAVEAEGEKADQVAEPATEAQVELVAAAAPKSKKSSWPFGLGSSKLSEADAQQVEKLLAYGDLAMSKKKYDQARQYFLEALAISPENETAQKFLTVAEYHVNHPLTPSETQKMSILDKVKQQESLQIQAVKSNWVYTKERSSMLVAEGKYAAALSEIVQAIAGIESNKQLLGDEVYTSLKTEAEGLRAQVEQYRNESEVKTQEVKIANAAELQKRTADKIEQERQENIMGLLDMADKFAQQRRYQNAIDTIDRILTIDPSNETAKYLRNSYEQFLLWQEQYKIAREGDKAVVNLLIDTDNKLIPPSGAVDYPDKAEWLEKDKRVPKVSTVNGSKAATLTKLKDTKIKIEFEDMSLTEVLDVIAKEGEVVILPIWSELDLAGITQDDLVTMRGTTMAIGKALDFVFNYVSAGAMGKAGYKVDEDGNIVVKAVGDDYGYEFRTYYVGELVRPNGGGMGGMMGGMGGGMMGGMGGGMMGGMGGGMMGGMGGGMMGGMGGMMGGMGGMGGGMMGGMGGGYGYDQVPLEEKSQNNEEKVKNKDGDMINLSYTDESQNPENWVNVQNNNNNGNNNGGNNNNNGGMGGGNNGGYGGGGMGGGRGMGGSNMMQLMQLQQLIMQTIAPNSWLYGMNTNMMNGNGMNQQGQDQDQPQLDLQGRGMIIPYSTTYLSIRQTPEVHQLIVEFLEVLKSMQGDQVSLESRLLTINNNILEDIGIDVDFLLSASEYGWDKWSDINVEQQHAEWASPSSSTGMTGSLGGGAVPSAFEMSGSFLDNIQVDFLIRATKANNRSRMLTAPHVTVFNGENAYVNFSREFSYVSELTPEVDTGVVAYDPTIDTLTSGIELNLTPYITSDKRYVVMNINFDQEILDSMFDYSYVNGSTDSTVDQVDGTTVPNQRDLTVRIQLPQTSVTQITTSVSVPDGGTLLLGGQKLVGEVEQESGVPGLAHIPILNRLFSTRNKTKDENIILVLIKPQIIIQSEMEEDNFGSLELDEKY